MFTNIFYLILALLVISLSPQGDFSPLTPISALLFSLGIYACLLIAIYFQSKYLKLRRKNLGLTLVNLELLLFLLVYHFILQGNRVFSSLPYFASTFQTLFSLILFFLGLACFHFCSGLSSFSSAYSQIAFLLPFVLPFFLLTFLLEVIDKFTFFNFKHIQEMTTPQDILIMLTITFGFMALMLVFLPPFIQWIWRCQPLEPTPLRTKLEEVCHRAGFKHPKLKTWTVLNHSMTAAIIGVTAPFKYILFTKKLLNKVSPEAIEAILAHEIGHSDRKHLLIYPLILLGFMVLTGILSLIFSQSIEEMLLLTSNLYPSLIWDFLIPLMAFVLYGGLILLYFRIVFGFFSRLFERQADLHVFALDIPPDYMIKALDELGVASGNTHDHPSWHHYSIQQRIDFLKTAEQNPQIVLQHHQKVKKWLNIYFFGLFLATLLFICPWMPFITPFKQIQEKIQQVSYQIDRWWNHSLRNQLAEKYIVDYGLQGNMVQIRTILDQTFSLYGVGKTTEEVNLIAAQRLYYAGETQASIELLRQIWMQLSLNNLAPVFFIEVVQFSDLLLNKSVLIDEPGLEQLRREYQKKMRLIMDQSKEI